MNSTIRSIPEDQEHQSRLRWHIDKYADKLPPQLAVIFLKLRDTYARNAISPPDHGSQGRTIRKHRAHGSKEAYVSCEYQLLHEVEALLGIPHEGLFKTTAVSALRYLAEAHDGVRR